MAKLEYSKLAEMVKKKLIEKGVSETDLNEDVIKAISETIKNTANEDFKNKVGNNIDNNVDNNVVSVDVSPEQTMPQETPGENPEVITQTTEVDEELSKKEGALDERERILREKELELSRKEEELNRKFEDSKYEPQLPEPLENVGPEQLFVFDMSKLSSGAESLSNLPMKLINNPEEETTMKNLWLEKAKKKAEVFVVKFEKVGEVIFNPFEGTSDLINFKDANPDNNLNDLQNGIEVKRAEGSQENSVPSNMTDSIEPVKNIIKPMSSDMGLSIDTQNVSLEDIIKQYLKQKEMNQ
jgi:hypothetical protein